MRNEFKILNSLHLENSELQKSECEKISFLNHVSHGIRTPLNAIMGFSKLMILNDVVKPSQMKYLKGILRGGSLLMEFVDNLLDLSQFEAKNYSPTIRKFDINQALWEFTEEFYSHKIENKDSDLNLMLVWDSKAVDLEIETDPILFKKSIQRLLNLVSKKYPINEYELGYRLSKDNTINVFLRPALEKLDQKDFLEKYEIYSVSEDDSFDYFNYKVLNESVEMIHGHINICSRNQEYSFSIPLNSNKN